MPKFYKQNILTNKPENPAPQDYASSFTDLGAPPMTQQSDLSQYLSPAPPSEEEHPQQPHEEALLPSPLDTPEITPGDVTTPTILDEPFDQSSESHLADETPLVTTSSTTPHHAGVAPIPESKLVETLMTWQAPSRPHRKKDRSFYITVATLIILIAMIALLAGERMLVAVLFAFMFLVYVINFIPPQEIEFKLSTQGVTIDAHFYHWQELDSFWFEKRDGHMILHILTQLRFPGMLMLVLSPNLNPEDVKHTVARFLPFHEIAPKSVFEKWAESLQRYFPLENPNK